MTAPRTTTPRLLVAGIGNIFLGDDAFGVEVAQRLLRRPRRDGVRVVDFGIRGLDLTYALLDGCDVAILIDAVPRGEPPGTLFVLEPQIDSSGGGDGGDGGGGGGGADATPMIDAHAMDPVRVLKTVTALGGRLNQIFIVGCEPSPQPAEDETTTGLSGPVRAAVDQAVALIESLVDRVLDRGTNLTPDREPPPSADTAAHREEMQYVKKQSHA